MQDSKLHRKQTQSESHSINNNMINFIKNIKNCKTIMKTNRYKFKKFKEKIKKLISIKLRN